MKNLILKYNEKHIFFILIAIGLFPILPRGIESSLMIAASVVALLFFLVKKKKDWDRSKTKDFFALSSLFFIGLITILYSQNKEDGFSMLQRMLPLVLFPLVFLFNKNNSLGQRKIEIIQYFYIAALLVSLLIIQTVFFTSTNFVTLSSFKKRALFENIANVHGTYFSIWIGFGVILLTFLIEKFKRSKISIFLLPIGVYFIYWQFVIGARMPLISTLLVLISYLIYKSNKWIILGLFVMLSGIIFFAKNEGVSQKIYNLKNYDFSFPKGQYSVNYSNISNEQIRNGIYYCAYQQIKKSPIFGYGIGDADDKLQECYNVKFTDTDTYKIIEYNSHNQYLNIVLFSGFTGLIVFIFSLTVLFKKALNRHNKLYLAFLCFVLFNFCFENILSRHDGVLFFSFFNSLLFFQTNDKKSTY